MGNRCCISRALNIEDASNNWLNCKHHTFFWKRMSVMAWLRGATASMLVLCVPAVGYAQCSMLSYNLDDAATKLKRTLRSTDFDEARDNANRARRALDDAAMSAQSCGCTYAYSELDDAARRARRARDASSVDEFNDEMRRSVRDFNSGVEALRACSLQQE